MLDMNNSDKSQTLNRMLFTKVAKSKYFNDLTTLYKYTSKVYFTFLTTQFS